MNGIRKKATTQTHTLKHFKKTRWKKALAQAHIRPSTRREKKHERRKINKQITSRYWIESKEK